MFDLNELPDVNCEQFCDAVDPPHDACNKKFNGNGAVAAAAAGADGDGGSAVSVLAGKGKIPNAGTRILSLLPSMSRSQSFAGSDSRLKALCERSLNVGSSIMPPLPRSSSFSGVLEGGSGLQADKAAAFVNGRYSRYASAKIQERSLPLRRGMEADLASSGQGETRCASQNSALLSNSSSEHQRTRASPSGASPCAPFQKHENESMSERKQPSPLNFESSNPSSLRIEPSNFLALSENSFMQKSKRPRDEAVATATTTKDLLTRAVTKFARITDDEDDMKQCKSLLTFSMGYNQEATSENKPSKELLRNEDQSSNLKPAMLTENSNIPLDLVGKPGVEGQPKEAKHHDPFNRWDPCAAAQIGNHQDNDTCKQRDYGTRVAGKAEDPAKIDDPDRFWEGQIHSENLVLSNVAAYCSEDSSSLMRHYKLPSILRVERFLEINKVLEMADCVSESAMKLMLTPGASEGDTNNFDTMVDILDGSKGSRGFTFNETKETSHLSSGACLALLSFLVENKGPHVIYLVSPLGFRLFLQAGSPKRLTNCLLDHYNEKKLLFGFVYSVQANGFDQTFGKSVVDTLTTENPKLDGSTNSVAYQEHLQVLCADFPEVQNCTSSTHGTARSEKYASPRVIYVCGEEDSGFDRHDIEEGQVLAKVADEDESIKEAVFVSMKETKAEFNQAVVPGNIKEELNFQCHDVKQCEAQIEGRIGFESDTRSRDEPPYGKRSDNRDSHQSLDKQEIRILPRCDTTKDKEGARHKDRDCHRTLRQESIERGRNRDKLKDLDREKLKDRDLDRHKVERERDKDRDRIERGRDRDRDRDRNRDRDRDKGRERERERDRDKDKAYRERVKDRTKRDLEKDSRGRVRNKDRPERERTREREKQLEKPGRERDHSFGDGLHESRRSNCMVESNGYCRIKTDDACYSEHIVQKGYKKRVGDELDISDVKRLKESKGKLDQLGGHTNEKGAKEKLKDQNNPSVMLSEQVSTELVQVSHHGPNDGPKESMESGQLDYGSDAESQGCRQVGEVRIEADNQFCKADQSVLEPKETKQNLKNMNGNLAGAHGEIKPEDTELLITAVEESQEDSIVMQSAAPTFAQTICQKKEVFCDASFNVRDQETHEWLTSKQNADFLLEEYGVILGPRKSTIPSSTSNPQAPGSLDVRLSVEASDECDSVEGRWFLDQASEMLRAVAVQGILVKCLWYEGPLHPISGSGAPTINAVVMKIKGDQGENLDRIQKITGVIVDLFVEGSTKTVVIKTPSAKTSVAQNHVIGLKLKCSRRKSLLEATKQVETLLLQVTDYFIRQMGGSAGLAPKAIRGISDRKTSDVLFLAEKETVQPEAEESPRLSRRSSYLAFSNLKDDPKSFRQGGKTDRISSGYKDVPSLAAAGSQELTDVLHHDENGRHKIPCRLANNEAKSACFESRSGASRPLYVSHLPEYASDRMLRAVFENALRDKLVNPNSGVEGGSEIVVDVRYVPEKFCAFVEFATDDLLKEALKLYADDKNAFCGLRVELGLPSNGKGERQVYNGKRIRLDWERDAELAKSNSSRKLGVDPHADKYKLLRSSSESGDEDKHVPREEHYRPEQTVDKPKPLFLTELMRNASSKSIRHLFEEIIRKHTKPSLSSIVHRPLVLDVRHIPSRGCAFVDLATNELVQLLLELHSLRPELFFHMKMELGRRHMPALIGEESDKVWSQRARGLFTEVSRSGRHTYALCGASSPSNRKRGKDSLRELDHKEYDEDEDDDKQVNCSKKRPSDPEKTVYADHLPENASESTIRKIFERVLHEYMTEEQRAALGEELVTEVRYVPSKFCAFIVFSAEDLTHLALHLFHLNEEAFGSMRLKPHFHSRMEDLYKDEFYEPHDDVESVSGSKGSQNQCDDIFTQHYAANSDEGRKRYSSHRHIGSSGFREVDRRRSVYVDRIPSRIHEAAAVKEIIEKVLRDRRQGYSSHMVSHVTFFRDKYDPVKLCAFVEVKNEDIVQDLLEYFAIDEEAFLGMRLRSALKHSN